MINMDKRGEKVYVLIWFLASILVFIVVVYTATSHFSQPIDLRGVGIQNDYMSVLSCYVSQGVLKPEVLSGNFQVTDCGFFADSISKYEGLVQVKIMDVKENKQIYSNFVGAVGLLDDCAVASTSSGAASYPVCFSAQQPVFYYSGSEKKIALLSVDIASNNRGSSVNTQNSLLSNIGVNTNG